jgi:cytochrome P450
MLEAYLIFFFSCLFIYHYIINNFTPLYWKRKGFPTINGEIPLGDLLLGKKSAIDSDIDYYKKVGKHKAAGLMEFGNPTLFIKDLDLVRDIFIKDFDYFVDHRHFANSDPMLSDSLFFLSGQSWKDMRSFLSPTFTSGKIRKMFKHFERSCQNLRKYIKICSFPNSKTGGYNVTVTDAVRRFTCEVIGSSVFGVDVDVFINRDSEFNKQAGKLGEFGFKRKIQMGIAMNLPKLAKLLQIRLMDPEASDFFIGVMEHTMNFREEERPIDDFLHLLLEAKNKGVLNPEEVAEDEIHYTEEQVTSKSNIKWTDKLAMNQAMIFLVAG